MLYHQHEDDAGIGTPLEPPEDKSITALVIRGFIKNTMRILEHGIIDKFAAYGVIKSVSFFAWESRALDTFTTREGAEKAFQALSKFLFIDDQRLKLAWATPLEVGGSSTTENNDASSNIPIICQYCRATAAAVENESDTSQMLHRLSMLKHYQSPSWHVNQNTNAL
ncbi:hypothetical protein Bca52824_084191 [Brassica carinata]|uniref:RRM domain-containing protein n=2 Tax=Brassica TaxID=3705 RepID=A0A8X7TTH2_BRACI|nr:hypothetical protein Bca52824_084191 [Brassica carinata]